MDLYISLLNKRKIIIDAFEFFDCSIIFLEFDDSVVASKANKGITD